MIVDKLSSLNYFDDAEVKYPAYSVLDRMHFGEGNVKCCHRVLPKYFIKLLIILFVMVGQFLPLCMSEVHAETLSFAVSPSKVDDCIVAPGGSTKIKFNVGNRTDVGEGFVEVNGEKINKMDLFKFDVLVNYSVEDYLGNEVDIEGLVTFNKDRVKCEPMTADNLEATIRVPSYLECNPYTLYINFIRQPIDKLKGDENNLSVIKVPVYLFVGTPDQFNKVKPDFVIEDLEVLLNDEKGTTLMEEYIKNMKSLFTLNPMKVYSTFTGVLDKPFYNFKGVKCSSFDIKDDRVNLEDITVRNKKTPWRYIDLNSINKEELVSNVIYNSDSIVLMTGLGETLKIELTPNYVINVREQMKVLKSYKTLSVEALLRKLNLPAKNTYDPIDYNLGMQINSKGKKPDTVQGDAQVFKSTTDLLSEVSIQPFTVLPSKSRDLKVPLKIQNLSEDDYNINLTLLGKAKVRKEVSLDFLINTKLRYKLFAFILVSYIIGWAILSGLIFLFLKNRNKNVGYIPTTAKVKKEKVVIYDEDGEERELVVIVSYDENGTYVYDKPKENLEKAKVILTLEEGEKLVYISVEEMKNYKKGKTPNSLKFYKVDLDIDVEETSDDYDS